MKPYGGYIPKNLLDGEDEYIEFYKADEVKAALADVEADRPHAIRRVAGHGPSSLR